MYISESRRTELGILNFADIERAGCAEFREGADWNVAFGNWLDKIGHYELIEIPRQSAMFLFLKGWDEARERLIRYEGEIALRYLARSQFV